MTMETATSVAIADDAQYHVAIDEAACKGCELCVAVCPKGNLLMDRDRINGAGFHPAVFDFHGLEGPCIGCGHCYRVCPDAAVVAIWERSVEVMQ